MDRLVKKLDLVGREGNILQPAISTSTASSLLN